MPKRRFSQFLLIALVASLLLSALPFSEGAGDFWMTKAAMPTARTDFQVGVVNGKIYAIGGYNNGTSLAVNEEYDPKTDTWTTKAPMPTARNGFAMFVFENKIHIVGGVIYPVHEFTLAHEVYDPATNTWETKSPASAIGVGVGFEANVVNAKAYIISGGASLWYPWPNTRDNEVYDPLTDEWLTKEPIPTGVFKYASAVVDKKIYVMGGRDISKNVTYDLTQIYDTETDTWSYGASVPTGLSGAGAAATTGTMAPKRIYFIGGYTCIGGGGMFYSESHNLNQIYDPEKDALSTGARMLTSRSDFGLAVVDDVLYAIGGYDGENYLNVNEQYTPIGYGTLDPSYVPLDSTAPVVSVLSPENKTYYTTDIQLTFTVNELDVWMRYKLDAEVVGEITGNTTLTGLSYGAHNLTVYATDASGNTGTSETIYFTIVEPAPEPEPFPTAFVAIASGASVVVVGAVLAIYFKKRKRQVFAG